MNYPPDWPCTCGHRKNEHLNIYVYGFEKRKDCQVREEDGFQWMDGCNRYMPIDNLTFVEMLANERTAEL